MAQVITTGYKPDVVGEHMLRQPDVVGEPMLRPYPRILMPAKDARVPLGETGTKLQAKGRGPLNYGYSKKTVRAYPASVSAYSDRSSVVAEHVSAVEERCPSFVGSRQGHPPFKRPRMSTISISSSATGTSRHVHKVESAVPEQNAHASGAPDDGSETD